MKRKFLSTAIVAILLLSETPLITAVAVTYEQTGTSSSTKESTQVISDTTSKDSEKNNQLNSESTIDTQTKDTSTSEKESVSIADTERSIKDETFETSEKNNETNIEKEISNKIKVYTPESLVVKEIAEKITSLSFDDVLADFGGRVSAGSLNKPQHVTVPSEKEEVDRYQLDDAFLELQNNSTKFVADVLNHFTEYNTLSEENAISDIETNLNSLILLKVYFDRWYGITIGGVSLADQMFYKQESNKDLLNLGEEIKKKPQFLNSSLTGFQYRQFLQPYYGYKDVPELIEAFVYEQTQSNDYDSWFLQYFKGSIYEAESKYKEVSVSVWDKVKNNLNGIVSKNESANGTDNLLLPLLTVKHSEGLVLASAPGIIIYSSKKQYGDNLDSVMNQTVTNFTNFFDTILDTHTDTQRNEILKQIKTIPVYDTDRYKYDEGSNTTKFNYYDETNILSHEFYLAIGLTKNFANSNATGIPQGITFKVAKINNGSVGTLAHEYMHSISHIILETEIDPSKYGFRERNHLETIASRVNNSPSYWGGLPWVIYESTDYASHTKDPLANSADRFQNPEDLQEYFGGYTSLVNIMDQVVADVVLEMSLEDQIGYIRQWNRTTKQFKTLTDQEIEELNLQTIDDLVDNDIVIVDKSVKDGEPGYNSYGENFYTKYSLYYPAAIDEEPVAALSDSIQLFDTLMALPQYTGWDAVREFFSKNTAAENDLAALRLVTKDTDMDFVKLKKNSLHENENKVKKEGLKDHSYNDLIALFKENQSNFQKVKTDLYKHYITETSEFRTSIFGEANENLLWGEAPYTFDENTGVLTVESGNLGTYSESPWNQGGIEGDKIEKIIFKDKNNLPENSKWLFSSTSTDRYLSNLKVIEGISNLDTTQVTDMSYMFFNLSSLSKLDLKGFDTSQVADMSYMFGSGNLSFLDISSFDTGNVTSMKNMFDKNNTIQELVLGSDFRFINPPEPALPEATAKNNEESTGKWINYDSNTNSYGDIAYSPDEFMYKYGSDDLTAGTYIAEPSNVKLEISTIPSSSQIGEKGVGQLIVKGKELQSSGKATEISMKLTTSKDHLLSDFWIVEERATLTRVDHNGQTISTQNIIINDQYNFKLPDLDLSSGEEFHISITGENQNNTISKEDIGIEVEYNSGYSKDIISINDFLTIKSGAFKFQSIPTALKFKTERINISSTAHFIDREDYEWTISINDLRGTNVDELGLVDRKDWKVYATASPFKDKNGYSIDQSVLAIAYIANGKTLELDETNEVEIYSHSVSGENPIDNQKVDVKWNEDNGLKAVVHNLSMLNSNTMYTAILNFELVNEPI